MSLKQNDEYYENRAEMEDKMAQDIDEALDKAIPVVEETNPTLPMYTHIDAYYKGFHTEFVIPAEKDRIPAGKVVIAIENLILKGFEPSWNKETTKSQLNPEPPDASEHVKAPKCSIHGTPMVWKSGTSKKTGKAYAFFSCPEKLADGSWCNGQAMKE
jgi:hypothetical protein